MSTLSANDATVTALNGLCTLRSPALALLESVDARVVAWAAWMGAEEVRFPPLVSVRDLASIDYFESFPQLPLLASRLADPTLSRAPDSAPPTFIDPDQLAEAEYALPSSACYNVYFGLRSARALPPTRITTRARCFRNEEHYEGLRRLRSFEMREIVFLGDSDGAAEHLATAKRLISDWCRALGLDVAWRTGGDPFFDRRGPRALAQRIAPVKEELIYRDELAVASINTHRNFFGERCDISDESGAPVYTSCVGFGLERWVAALLDASRSPEEAAELVRNSW